MAAIAPTRAPLDRGRSYRLKLGDVPSNNLQDSGGRVLDAVASLVPMCVREHYRQAGAQLRHHIPTQVSADRSYANSPCLQSEQL